MKSRRRGPESAVKVRTYPRWTLDAPVMAICRRPTGAVIRRSAIYASIGTAPRNRNARAATSLFGKVAPHDPELSKAITPQAPRAVMRGMAASSAHGHASQQAANAFYQHPTGTGRWTDNSVVARRSPTSCPKTRVAYCRAAGVMRRARKRGAKRRLKLRRLFTLARALPGTPQGPGLRGPDPG